MADTKLLSGKNGLFYRIRISAGRGKRYSTNWHVPSELQTKAESPVKRVREKAEKDIADALAVAVAEFEQKIKNGEVLTRSEKAEQKKQAEIEAAKIKTLREFCEQDFIPTKELIEGCSKGTIAFYRAVLKHLEKHSLYDYSLPEIKPVMIKQLFIDEQSGGASSDMLIRIYKTLKQVFDRAARLDMIEYSPMAKVERPKLSKQEKAAKKEKVEFLTAEQLNNIISYAKEDIEKAKNKRKEQACYKWYIFICLATFSGMRRGEICGLEWRNIDFKRHEITIDKHITFVQGYGLQIEAATKNGHFRKIPVDANTISLLEEYKRYKMNAGESEDQFIFTQADTIRPLSPQSVTAYFSEFKVKHGLEDLNLHCHLLRHSYASLSVQGGADIASLSKTLGHSSISVTLDLYTHSNMEAQRKVSDIFSNALKQEEQRKQVGLKFSPTFSPTSTIN